MITRQYYGRLVDNKLIVRGDFQNICNICNEKKLTGIDGGKITRQVIFDIVKNGRYCTPEVVEVITEYFEKKIKAIEKQNQLVKA
jgi:hypothetical protein